jgi:hypothetical protein
MPSSVRRASVRPWTRLTRVVTRPLLRALRLLLVALSGLGPVPPPLFPHEDAVVEVANEGSGEE